MGSCCYPFPGQVVVGNKRVQEELTISYGSKAHRCSTGTGAVLFWWGSGRRKIGRADRARDQVELQELLRPYLSSGISRNEGKTRASSKSDPH